MTAGKLRTMSNGRTTLAVQRQIDALSADPHSAAAQQLVRDLVAVAVRRLHLLCANMLHRHYPRLTRPPFNVQEEELLSSVVARLIRALSDVKLENVRQFFALANMHMRWELNDLARRLDEQAASRPLGDHDPAAPASVEESGVSTRAMRILGAIERMPEQDREVFELIKIQEMTQIEVAELLHVSAKTVQRRLHRGLLWLANELSDLNARRSTNGTVETHGTE